MENYNEPILTENRSRFVLFPISKNYKPIYDMFKEAQSHYWTTEKIDLSTDTIDWNNKLNDNERHYIKYVLAFFAASDGIVNENLVLRFYNEVKIPEARAFYAFQIYMETIHSETYSVLIDTLISDENEKAILFNAIENIPSIKKKADWTLKWLSSNASFGERILAFAVVEGIFFSGSFCAIFWLKKRGLMSGLTFSNEEISADENQHCTFALLLYCYLINKPNIETIYSIFKEAVEIEKEFVKESLPVKLIGMNADIMCQYIEFVADKLLWSIDIPPIYGSKNPFDWMVLMSLSKKTNFFEKRVSDYAKFLKNIDQEHKHEIKNEECFY